MEMQNERTRARLGSAQVIYVLGGFSDEQKPVDVVERYDSRTSESTIVQVGRTIVFIYIYISRQWSNDWAAGFYYMGP